MERDEVCRKLEEIRAFPGNDNCADCGRKGPLWAVYNLGILICDNCVKIHHALGSQISRIKSLQPEDWTEDQLKILAVNGNEKSKLHFERNVPLCYRRPQPDDCSVMIEQWIRGKYERLDFIEGHNKNYTNGHKAGFLWKKLKDSRQFAKRRFVINEKENSLVYFIHDEAKSPKATLRLDQLNMTIVPEKIGNPNAMQIMTSSGSGFPRNIFVYADNAQELIEWYTALRSAKLNRLLVAFPHANADELCRQLSRDFLVEGWLQKSGPKASDTYRRRWAVLDENRLHYYEDPLDPFPKGTIVIGSRESGFAAREDVPPGFKALKFSFTLKTPRRNYGFGAVSEAERAKWLECLLNVIRKSSSVPFDGRLTTTVQYSE